MMFSLPQVRTEGLITRHNWTIRQRLESRIELNPSSGCWEWTGVTSVGYGRVGFSGRLDLTHRVVYHLFVGELISGMHIDHLCRNRRCCNPEHLEQVTPAENQRRAASLLTHCARGHEFTAESTYVRRDGGRDCRPCKLLRQQAWRAANPTWRTGVASSPEVVHPKKMAETEAAA